MGRRVWARRSSSRGNMIRANRLNRAASVAVLVMMTLAVAVGARWVRRAGEAVVPPPSGLLVVANLRGESITTIDLAEPGAGKTLSLFGPPHEMVTADGHLYVTLGRANALVEIDPWAPGILRSLAIDGEPHGLALDGDDLLVTLARANALVRIDRNSLRERSREPTGDTPHTVAVANGVAYITDSRDNRLRAATQTGAMTAAAGTMPESAAVSGDLIVTADAGSGTLTVFRPSLERVAQVRVGGSPVRVVGTRTGEVAAAVGDRAEVVVVEPGTGMVRRRVKVNGRPDGLCVDPSGAYIGVASNETGTLQVFRLADWKLATTVETSGGSGACLWLPGR